MIAWLIFFILFTRMTNSVLKIPFASATSVEGKFKLSEVTDNRAIWNLPESCTFSSDKIHLPPTIHYTPKEDQYAVRGPSWHCQLKHILTKVHENFFGYISTEKFENWVKLNYMDCIIMRKKTFLQTNLIK